MTITTSGYKRTLTSGQRVLVDEWLARAGITHASRIRRLGNGRTGVMVVVDGREDGWLTVSDPPFPWSSVLQRAG